MIQINQLEGAPNFPLIYTQPQPTDVFQACQGLLDRYKTAFKDSYMDQIDTLMASANSKSSGQTFGDAKLQFSAYDDYADVLLMYSYNGTDFQAKSLHLSYQNKILTEFSDDWFLFKVGSTQVNISKDQAVLDSEKRSKKLFVDRKRNASNQLPSFRQPSVSTVLSKTQRHGRFYIVPVLVRNIVSG